LKQALNPNPTLDFDKSKAKFFPIIGRHDARTQKDGFSCADWMSLSSIHVMAENPHFSEAKRNFLSLKQSLMEKNTEEFVHCHRQLLVMLLFLCNSKLFEIVDMDAEARITDVWNLLRDSALAMKASCSGGGGGCCGDPADLDGIVDTREQISGQLDDSHDQKVEGDFENVVASIFSRPVVHEELPRQRRRRDRRSCSSCEEQEGLGVGTAGGPLKFLVCSRCRSVAYCCTDCQRVDWYARHKDECRAIIYFDLR